MITFNQYKARCTINFFLFFLSLMVLTGCKPDIDGLFVLVFEDGQPSSEGRQMPIDGNIVTLDPIKPGDKLHIELITSDGNSDHIANHAFQWGVIEGDIGEWQIHGVTDNEAGDHGTEAGDHGTEAGELGEVWGIHLDKDIMLTAPKGVDSKITLEVTVICNEVDGPDNSTALQIKIVSERSEEEIRKEILANWKKASEHIHTQRRLLNKVGGEKQVAIAKLFSKVTEDYAQHLLAKAESANAKVMRGLRAKVEGQNNFVQKVSGTLFAADDYQNCKDTLPKFSEDSHKLQDEYHHNLCHHTMDFKNSMEMEEKCFVRQVKDFLPVVDILDVRDRITGDLIQLSCVSDEDSKDEFTPYSVEERKSDEDSKDEFTPYFEKRKYFVVYRLTEDENYTLIGNVKEFPSILGYKMPATEIDCDPIKGFDFCTKDIPKNQIDGVRLMLSKLYEKKYPIVCGGKNNGDCNNGQISSNTSLIGKRNQPDNDNENTNNHQGGYKRQKKGSDTKYKTSTEHYLDKDIKPDEYCRTVSYAAEDYSDNQKQYYEHGNSRIYPPVYPKNSEKEFVKKAKEASSVVLCFSATFADTEGQVKFPIKLEWKNFETKIDCDIYNTQNQLVSGNICEGNSEDPITLFIALPSNFNGGKPEFSFKDYYVRNRLIISHIEKLPLGNVEAVTIKNRHSMFSGATNLEYVDIDTSSTVDMSHMFAVTKKFNQDLSTWNVTNVTNMESMFTLAEDFNSPLFSKTCKVKDMKSMFRMAREFNKPINFCTDSVTDMESMFHDAKKFNQDINGWNVENVMDMQYMFTGASEFNKPLDRWRPINVRNMRHMFEDAKEFNSDIFGDTPQVKTMQSMFEGAKKFNQSINGLDVRKVESMYNMFRGAEKFNQNINGWNVEKVWNMGGMFHGASEFNQPLHSWKPFEVKIMKQMFRDAKEFNSDIFGHTSQVTTTESMFHGAKKFNQSINSWDVKKVTIMQSMFQEASAFNQPLNGWNVEKVTNMVGMFHVAKKFNQDINGWNVEKVENMSHMFRGASEFNQPLDSWKPYALEDTASMFSGAKSFNQDTKSWLEKATNLKHTNNMYKDCNIDEGNKIDLSAYDNYNNYIIQ